ncbi:hypothetical protein L596_004955 [Steinernema carpocapsae]|uniref:CRC domain-containing protein n=1 Tax=Steinernema carpocapsae TaxID=34508 RepID=A0A4U8V1M5_STECR|nr:hypothetical protein L596_004955 [Steinernema carpocapsae]
MAEQRDDPSEPKTPRRLSLLHYVDPQDERLDVMQHVDEEVLYAETGVGGAFQGHMPPKRNALYQQPLYNQTQMFQQPGPGTLVRRVIVPRQVQPQPSSGASDLGFHNKAKVIYRVNKGIAEPVHSARGWAAGGLMRTTPQPQRNTQLMETQNTLYRAQLPPYNPYAQASSSSAYADDYASEVLELVPSKPFTPTAYVPPAKSTQKKKLPAGAKKPCNCNKSMCLKLYCDCFANGEFCRDCNCKDCHNNLDHEAERSRAIKASLERNPNAFKPKIGNAKGKSDVERLHQKGCHCKKSNCLKNYCECFEAKVPCTDRCKCCSCRNTETDRASRQQEQSKQQVQNAQTSSSLGPPAVKSLLNGFNISDDESDSKNKTDPENPKASPWFYLTDEVVETTTLCLIARMEEAEGRRTNSEALESIVLKEFARCLEEIIENSNKALADMNNQPSMQIPPLVPKEEEDDDEDIKVEVE